MTQPVAYVRAYNFTSFSAAFPSTPQPGVKLDAEFNGIKATTDAIRANLAKIQRDDGRLANGSVSLDQVGSDVLMLVGTSWTVRGPWAAATLYAVGDVVSSAGTTYACGVAHTSTVLATDVVAGRWVVLWSSSGVVPSDASVTTAKIADGAVTAAKLAFTSLSLSGTISGAGGLSAGTATPGAYIVAGATNAGAAYLSIARTTVAQGVVGVRLDGGVGGGVFEVRQAGGSNDLSIYNGGLAANQLTLTAAGPIDAAYTLRATGAVSPLAGAGVETYYTGGVGYVSAYDRTGAVAKQLNLQGLTVLLVAGGVTVGTVTTTKADFLGLSIGGKNAGFLGAPVNPQSAGYTIAASDCGKRVLSSNAGAQTITIATQATVAIPVDDAVVVIANDGTTVMTITPAAGVTLIFAGGALTGARTLGLKGIATLMQMKPDEWWISGVGVS